MLLRVALLLFAVGGLTVPLTAQFRAEKRTADKEFELRDYPAAVESYQRALQLRPDDVEVLTRLGDAHRMLNQLDTARQYYEQAMNNRRAAPAALLAYAQTLKSLGEYEEARPFFLTYASEGDQRVGNHYASSIDFALTQQGEAAGYTVATVPFNSYAADFGPAMVNPDELVFNSARLEGEFSGKAENKPYRVVRSTLGQWQPPAPLANNYISGNGNVGPVSYSPSGNRVVFTRNTFAPGVRMVPEAGIVVSLMIADVNEAGNWSNVRPLPFNGSGFSTGFGTFGADGDDIYFASDRPGGFGGYDLYRAQARDGQYESVPENLGPAVNSEGNEITPYYDGSSLYFASDWHLGLGAYDIFRAEVNTARRPVALYHLGGAVNSPRDDYGFVYDAGQRRGYLTSNRSGSRGAEDLYLVTLDEVPTISVVDTMLETAGVASGPQSGAPRGVSDRAPVPFGTVRGYVSDIQTGEPVADAAVVVTKRETGQAAAVTTDVEGAYYVEVEPNTVYDVTVEVAGYESMSFPVTTEQESSPNAFGNIQLLPVQTTYAGGVAPPAPTVVPDQYGSAPTGEGAPPGGAMVTEEGAIDPTGYSIQVATVTRAPQLQNFDKLASLGRVYVAETEGRYKVRVGGFASRQEAQAAAARAAAMGYSGSFVTAGSPPNGADPVAVPETEPGVASPAPAEPATNQAPYRVQLGAYGKPDNFNRSGAAALGTVGSTQRGELTIFYLDSLQSLSQAEAARNRAEAAGFTGAYILKLTDGEYRKQ